jgi:hypothetical protein
MVDCLLALAFVGIVLAPAIVAFVHWRKSSDGNL